MFKCEKCKCITNPREKENKVVVNKRVKTYTNDGKTSEGWEIEKEIKVCEKCNEEEVNEEGV